MIRKFKDAKGDSAKNLRKIDLTSLKSIISAAEPIDYHVMREFYETFESYGLASNILSCAYGLAESTLMVCCNGENVLNVEKAAFELNEVVVRGKTNIHGADPGFAASSDTQLVVGCGKISADIDQEVIIVNPETRVPVKSGLVSYLYIFFA